MNDDMLVALGGALKALGSGRWRGYLVQFGTPDQTDLVGDFFTTATDFDWPSDLPVMTGTTYYQHGCDPVLKNRKLGIATLGRDAFGVWAEGQLSLRDQYEHFIYQQIEAGRMGLSSGTLPNLVTRKAYPNGANEITHWPLGKDVSITPNPCEPRNSVIALKALLDGLEVDAQAALSASTMTITDTLSNTENATMAEELTTTTPAPAVAAEPATPVASVDIAAIAQQAAEAAIKAYEATAPALKSGGFVTPVATPTEPEGTPAERYTKAFNVYIRTGHAYPIEAQKAAMQVGTASEGGYLVPQTYSNELIKAMTEQSVLRQAGARVISLSGTKGFNVPSLNYSGAAVLTAEEAAFDQKEPTVGEITFSPYKFTKLSKVSDELLDDSRLDVTSEILAPDAAQSFAATENNYFVVGTGSAQPQGVLTGASLGKTAASATAITFDEIYDLIGSLFYGYRANAKFLMNDATLTVVRKLKDSNGQYLWQPSNQAGQPDRLAGYPVYVLNTMPTIATGNKTILFGDLSYFWIADIGQMTMQRLNELYAANGQVGFRWYKRADSRVMLSAALKYLQQA